MPAADGKTYSASLASDGARVTTPSLDFPFSSQTQVKAQCSPAPLQPTTQMVQPKNVFTNQIVTLNPTSQLNDTSKPPRILLNPCGFNVILHSVISPLRPNVYQAGVAELEDSALEKHASQTECQKTSMAPAVQQAAGQPVAGVYKYLSRTGSWSGSASLPRGYRRSEGSSRLSSTMAPRPFGTRQSSVSSLQRRCSVSSLVVTVALWMNLFNQMVSTGFYHVCFFLYLCILHFYVVNKDNYSKINFHELNNAAGHCAFDHTLLK